MIRLGAIVCLVFLFVVPLAGPASADNMLTTVRDDAGAVISNIDVADLYPTDAREHSVYVDIAPTVATGEAAVVLESVTNLENGCNHPEITSGDATCDTEGGELASQLQVTITPGRPAGLLPTCEPDETVAPVSASMAALEGQVVPLGETSAVLGRSLCFVVRQELPDLADNNLVQTDHVTYDMRVLGDLDLDPGNTIVLPGPVVSGDDDVRDVGGNHGAGGRVPQSGATGAPDPAEARLPVLASTGAGALLLLVTALASLAAGLRLRRRSGGPVRWSSRPAKP